MSLDSRQKHLGTLLLLVLPACSDKTVSPRSDRECKDGDICDGILSTCPGICTARIAVGDSCERDEQCESGRRCAPGSTISTCQPTTAVQGCATRTCEPGLFCLEYSTCSPLL